MARPPRNAAIRKVQPANLFNTLFAWHHGDRGQQHGQMLSREMHKRLPSPTQGGGCRKGTKQRLLHRDPPHQGRRLKTLRLATTHKTEVNKSINGVSKLSAHTRTKRAPNPIYNDCQHHQVGQGSGLSHAGDHQPPIGRRPNLPPNTTTRLVPGVKPVGGLFVWRPACSTSAPVATQIPLQQHQAHTCEQTGTPTPVPSQEPCGSPP